MMVKYVFRDDEALRIKAANKADPQVIGKALAKISEQAGGELTPRAVVDAAKATRHPLHKHFEWDDTKAADAYRLDQARSIIRVVRVVDTSANEGTSRAYFSVAGKSGVSYRSIDAVRSSLELQLAVHRQAERDLDAWTRRYRELTDVCDLVADARDKVARRREQLESHAPA